MGEPGGGCRLRRAGDAQTLLVYNLDLEGGHRYFISDADVLVRSVEITCGGNAAGFWIVPRREWRFGREWSPVIIFG